MTRTFVAGGEEPDAELAEYWALTQATRSTRSLPEIRPGVTGRDLYDITCEVFEAAGKPTHAATREGGRCTDTGFFHSLGHGVGIEIHEAPGLGLAGRTSSCPAT